MQHAGLASLAQWQNSAVDAALYDWWQQHDQPNQAPTNIAVALSGGADSVALLLALWRLAQQQQKPLTILALHVHHGLQTAASDFASYCQQLCAQLQAISPKHLTVLCHILPVQVACATGDSLEAQARLSRYQALAQAANTHQADVVLLGQHADDQTESVLLALSRGAGVDGIAAMPAQFSRNGANFARPLLDIAGNTLRQWLAQHDVAWIEDPTNDDTRFTRNKLRHTVVPYFQQAVAGLNTSIARSARLAAEAGSLLRELAQADLQHIGNPPNIKLLQQLSATRQRNVLRYWLKQQHNTIGSERQLLALQHVIAACTTRGHRIHIKVGLGYVQRQGDDLMWEASCDIQ